MTVRVDYSVEEMQELAASRKGKFLSKDFLGLSKYHKWKCEKGHIWEARANSVIRGSWCGKCVRPGKKRTKTIEDFKQIAKAKGGECLSEVYEGSTSKIRVRCKRGHEWEARANSVIRGSWCRICAQVDRVR